MQACPSVALCGQCVCVSCISAS